MQDDASGRLYTTFTQTSAFAPGDRVFLRGALRAFDPARNPGAFSEQEYARLRGLTAAIEAPQLRLYAHASDFDVRFWPARFRLWSRRVLAAKFPQDERAVLTGMLWGDHRDLRFETAGAFSATGTSHLLVTAGLHIGLFAGLLRLVLRKATVERSLAATLTIFCTWCACIVSDAHIPSIRAASMLSALLCAEMLGTKATSRRTLSYAACITLLLDPTALSDPSWYLSFSCVFAVIHLATICEQYLIERKIPHLLAKSLAVTYAAQIGTWPLIAAQFHQISVIAPLANLLAVPIALLTLCFAPCILPALALHCTPLVVAIAYPMHLLLAALIGVVHICAHLPAASIDVRTPAMWSLIAYEGALIATCTLCGTHATEFLIPLTHALRHRGFAQPCAWLLKLALNARLRRIAAIAFMVTASAAVILSTCDTSHDLRITMLDVGQGDGIVIETPRHHTIFIDTGGRLELHARGLAQSPAEIAAAHVLLPFLQYEGITHVDLLLLTHPHGDHAGGAAPVLRSLPVDLFLDGGQAYPGTAYQDALHAATLANVPRLIARRGQRISFDDGVTLQILAPIAPLFCHGRNDINENSIVALLTYQKLRVLFTGDAGMQAEARLLRAGDDLHADILKVGHHGSAYASSTAFLRAVRPRIAFISVGRHNLFHHPALPTLQRLQAVGARIYRTDMCGAVMIRGNAITTMMQC